MSTELSVLVVLALVWATLIWSAWDRPATTTAIWTGVRFGLLAYAPVTVAVLAGHALAR